MSHWGMEQPSFQPTYPSDCGERAKDTHNFLFCFSLGQQNCWQCHKTWKPSRVEDPSMILGDPHARKAGRHNRGTEEHGKTQSQWTLLANIPSWVLRMVELLNLIALKKSLGFKGKILDSQPYSSKSQWLDWIPLVWWDGDKSRRYLNTNCPKAMEMNEHVGTQNSIELNHLLSLSTLPPTITAKIIFRQLHMTARTYKSNSTVPPKR